MKKLLMLLIAAAMLLSIAGAQQAKVVHFKKLQELLPAKALAGFQRSKPIGNTQTTMGMSMSEASVRYVKPAANDTTPELSVTIKITDMAAMPFAGWAMAYQQQDMDSESEDGYEKTVTVKKLYKGIEKGQTGSYKSCELNFAVGDRFQVTFNASNIGDARIIYELVDAMDLEKLAVLTAEK